MNTNLVADRIEEYLRTKSQRVYRNKASKRTTFPYVIYRVGDSSNQYPSEDYSLNIDIYDKEDASARVIEELADSIDNGLNMTVVDTEDLNMHFDRQLRQYIPPEELVGVHFINLQYTVRTYFK